MIFKTKKEIVALSACVILLFIIFSCEKKQDIYGLTSNRGEFPYSYYVNKGGLLIKDINDLNKHFSSVDESAEKMDIDVALIQKILPGSKKVFVFESVDYSEEWPVLQRLCFECDSIKTPLLFPKNCRGSLMFIGGIPPETYVIESGIMNIKTFHESDGEIRGDLDLKLTDNVKLVGRFFLLNKDKRLMVMVPASFCPKNN